MNTGTSGGSWSYFWSLGQDAIPATSTSEDAIGVVYSSAGDKTVTFTISDQNCTQTSSDTITILQTPSASFASTAPECTELGVDFTNTGSTGGSWAYAWSFGSGATPGTSSLENPSGVVYSSDGTKLITFIISNTNCADTIIQSITIHLKPTANFSFNDSICAGTPVNFTNTGSTGANWSYDWDLGDDALPATSSSENAIGIIYQSGGTKTVTLTIADQNCTDTYSDTIMIYNYPTANAGLDTTICADRSVQIGDSAITGHAYSWFPTSTLDNPGSSNPTSSPIANITTYIVTITNTANGCQNMDSITVTMLNPLVADAGVDAEICINDSVQIGTGFIEGQFYAWAPATGLNDSTSSNPIAKPDSTTTYTITVTDTANCDPITDEVTVIVHPLPDAGAGDDDTITVGSSAQLIATGGVQYVWWPEAGLDNADLFNPLASPDSTTTYSVSVTDVFGCVNTDAVIIVVFDFDSPFWLPTAFTPDTDGRNDILYVRGEGFVGFEMIIYNRVGEMLFYTTDINEGWNGRKDNAGEEMPEGAYIYQVNGTTANGTDVNVNGMVNLVR